MSTSGIPVSHIPGDGQVDSIGASSHGISDGVKKEIITEGSGFKKPKTGDEVTVHYVGTLLADGSEFDSSRARNKPFSFSLGRGQVIKGWDLGVSTMKKGEVAKFTLDPEVAYGSAGSPPKIPENSSLVFEVELISWVAKNDLFGDEGVIKTLVEEGEGWKYPKMEEDVVLSIKSVAKNGEVIEVKEDYEYKLGSDGLVPLGRMVDKALAGMKKGEKSSFQCTPEYSYGSEQPEGATVELKLTQIYETKDVSAKKDRSMLKKLLREGEGFETPNDCAKVKLLISAAKDAVASETLEAFTGPTTLEFTTGNGEVCDALERAVLEMKKGEMSVITCTKPELIAEAKIGLKDLAELLGLKSVSLTVEMQEFEKHKETFSMDEFEKLEFATERKDAAASLFKDGRIALALERYQKICDLFGYVDNFKKEENKKKAANMKRVCELNKAACYVKQCDFEAAKTSCNAVLKDEASNAKALFRLAQADLGLKDFEACTRGLKKVLAVDPQNRDARGLLKQAAAGQKEIDQSSKGVFTNMCKDIGTGPIREPLKLKSFA